MSDRLQISSGLRGSRRLLSAALVGSLLALGACGDDENEPSPEPSSGERPAAKPAEEAPAPKKDEEGSPPEESEEGATPKGAEEEPVSKDPCTLLTKEEAEDALGGPSKPPEKEPTQGTDVSLCSWFPSGFEGAANFVQVSLTVPADGARLQYEAGTRVAPGAKEVSGIGEAAYTSDVGTHHKVTTLVGKQLLEVTTPDEESAIRLIKAALERL